MNVNVNILLGPPAERIVRITKSTNVTQTTDAKQRNMRTEQLDRLLHHCLEVTSRLQDELQLRDPRLAAASELIVRRRGDVSSDNSPSGETERLTACF